MQKCFKKIVRGLQLFLLTSIPAVSVKRSSSSLCFAKDRMRNSIAEDRFNALILLYVKREIVLYIDTVIDDFAK